MKQAKKKVKRVKRARRVKRATLADVRKKALTNPDFWDRLRTEPDAALRRMPLSKADRARLVSALRGEGIAEMDAVMKVVHQAVRFTPPRKAGWSGMWRFGWP